jgi:hypothetical protein
LEAPNRSLLGCIWSFGMCTHKIDLSDAVSSAPNEDRMQNLCPREVDVTTTPFEAHKHFGISSSGVMVLDVGYGFETTLV